MVKEIFRDALIAHFQQVRVSNAVPEGSVVLSVNLRRFEGVDDHFGELLLDAELSTAEGKEIYRIRITSYNVCYTKLLRGKV